MFKECECGCGQELIQKRKDHIPRYVNGHNNRGKNLTEEHKRKISKAHFGVPIHDEESIEKIIKGCRRARWSKYSYSYEWSEVLRKMIRERDGYICQKCSKYGNTVHHIDYNKRNCNLGNLINLCIGCNVKVNKNREYWKRHFTVFLSQKRLNILPL